MNPPDERDALRLETQDALGVPIVLRAIQTPDPALLGRLTERPGYLLVEYRDRIGGYFWDLDALREVLRLAREGKRNVSVYEDGRIVEDNP
jgi:hypothetical protein